MKKILSFSLAALAVFFTSCRTENQASGTRNRFIDDLMAQMTLEEKLGQLNLPVAGDIVTGQARSSNVADDIVAGRVGGLFNIKGVDAIRELQRIAVEESRLHIPLIFGMDVIHGYETVFPIPLAMACTWNPEAVRTSAAIAAQEATADGICWTFSPMVDICHDGRWGRISEGFGEDPYLVSVLGAAMVEGYQQADLSDSHSMMACVKHFALYGAPDGGRDYNTVDMSRYRMYNDYLPPYKACSDAQAGSFMASFNTIDGVPATCNRWLLTDLLRGEWGYKGFVVSDYTAILELLSHGIAADLNDASHQSLMAGLDMDMVSGGLLALSNPDIKAVDQACRRILEAKWKLGLFDDPYRYCNPERRSTEIYTEATRDEARRVARESMVLLKNDGNLLPLRKNATIALIGPLADTRANMPGTWSVAAVFDRYKTLREGLEDAVRGQGQILYAKGCNLMYDAQAEANATLFGREMRDARTAEAMRAEALHAAHRADIIVAAMGEASEMAGECSCRTDLEMPDAQRDLLRELVKTGKPIVLLNFSGRPVVLNWESQNLPAILQVWFAGSETGDAVADLLFGDYSPSGRLAVAFPRSVGQLPYSYRHYNTGRPLEDGQAFTKFRSCYLDEQNTPLYPFGYGLSYTTVEYQPLQLSSPVLKQGDKQGITATVTVTNTGKRATDEVVQLYIQDVVSRPVRPTCELRGFRRVHLEPGETRTVDFTVTAETLGFYAPDSDVSGREAPLRYVTPAGQYRLFTGPDAAHLIPAEIEVQ